MNAINNGQKTVARAWTKEEDEILKRLYLSMERTEIAIVLGRTIASIRKRCSTLKLNYKHPPVVDDELQKISQWYTDRVAANGDDFNLDALANELGRTKQFVSRLARKMGLTKSTRPLGERARKAIGNGTRKSILENGHPRGMSGKTHTAAFKAEQSKRVKSRVFTKAQIGSMVEKMMKTKIEKYGTGNPGWLNSSNPYSRTKSGKREDLDNKFFRSSWEANYARYLNWLIAQGQIAKWEFECQTFVFHGITRGVISYTPDFKVYSADGSYEWHEVKGWMDAKSKAKLKRMAKYYPEEKVVLIDAKVYKSLTKWKALIPNWE